jgi:TfoX/Sxy family transcriptional regulator of competence genes
MPAKAPTSLSLGVSDGFRAFGLDQLGGLDDLIARSMFGGVGLYSRGLFFGIMSRDRLYLKVDDRNRAAYVKAGEKPFKPNAGRPGSMQYYAVPLEVLESPTELVAWARDARGAAARSASRPRRVRKRASARPSRRS